MYAILLYLLCTLLFPDEMSDYSGFRGYFYSRKKWIFNFIALLFSVDVADTLIKGARHFVVWSSTLWVRDSELVS